MVGLDTTGSFWFPGSEKVALNGRLVFDAADGTSLTTFGGLSELQPNGELHEAWGGSRDRILGRIARDGHDVNVTLLDCLWRSPTSYDAQRLLIGGHFASNDTNFPQAIVRFGDLPAWVGQEALKIEVEEALDGVDRRELRVQLDRPPATHAGFNRGEIALDFRWGREDVEFERFTVHEWPQFELQYARQEPLSAIVDDVGHLRNLMTLCVDGPGAIETVYLYRPDYPERCLSGEAIPGTMQKIELRAAFLGARSPREHREPHRMLLSLEALGGIERLAAWLDAAPSLQIATGALVTMRSESIFAENRFLNVCSGAEGFHRTVVGGTHMPGDAFEAIKAALKPHVPAEHRAWFSAITSHANDPSLNRRLRELAQQLGDAAPRLVGDVATWGRVVSTCRNEITHMDGRRELYAGADLYWLAEGVFNVARLCMLLYAGLDAARLPDVMKTWPLQTSDRVQTTVKRLDEEQRRRKREG